MRKLILMMLAAGCATVAVVPAEAAQGCGWGGHRNFWGHCVGNAPVGYAWGGYYARPYHYYHGHYWGYRGWHRW